MSKIANFVSVVIPMRNERKHIERCVRSLMDQDYPKDLFEILVVDGMSVDGSREVVEALLKHQPNIFLIENPDVFTSFGLNAGIRKSKGEIIVILSAHSYAAPDFIRKNVLYLENAVADCVGGPIVSQGETVMARAVALSVGSPFGVGDAVFRYGESERYVDTLAFGAYKRAVFEKIGLFDEELIRNQDDEFNYRLRKAGGRLFITPQIKSFYYSRGNLIKLWKQYFLYGLWKIRVLQKHPGMMRLRQFVPACLILGVTVSFLLSISFPSLAPILWGVVISYIGSNLYFSLKIASKEGWRNGLILPMAFIALHFSYGLGFLYGLLRFVSKWFQHEPKPPALDWTISRNSEIL